MPTGFYCLARFFLRVDGVMIKVWYCHYPVRSYLLIVSFLAKQGRDTRIYHAFNTNFVLREHSLRESTYVELESAMVSFPFPLPSLSSSNTQLYSHRKHLRTQAILVPRISCCLSLTCARPTRTRWNCWLLATPNRRKGRRRLRAGCNNGNSESKSVLSSFTYYFR